MSQTTTLKYTPAVDLHSHNLQSAKNLVMKTIHEAYSEGNSRLRFMIGDSDGDIYKTFPKWMSDITVKHIIQNLVKHDGSYVVFLKRSDEEQDLSDTSFDINVIRQGVKDND